MPFVEQIDEALQHNFLRCRRQSGEQQQQRETPFVHWEQDLLDGFKWSLADLQLMGVTYQYLVWHGMKSVEDFERCTRRLRLEEQDWRALGATAADLHFQAQCAYTIRAL